MSTYIKSIISSQIVQSIWSITFYFSSVILIILLFIAQVNFISVIRSRLLLDIYLENQMSRVFAIFIKYLSVKYQIEASSTYTLNSFVPELTIVISSTTSRESPQFTNCSGWRWLCSGWEIKNNCHVLVKQIQGNFHHKKLSCRKIKSVYSDVEWCFNASWGLKGLRRWNICIQTMKTRGFFQFEIIIIVLVSSCCFIWLHMLWVYGN